MPTICEPPYTAERRHETPLHSDLGPGTKTTERNSEGAFEWNRLNYLIEGMLLYLHTKTLCGIVIYSLQYISTVAPDSLTCISKHCY